MHFYDFQRQWHAMKRLWLLFSQVVTIVLALYMVWLAVYLYGHKSDRDLSATQADALAIRSARTPPQETWRYAARIASPAVVSITTQPSDAQDLPLSTEELDVPDEDMGSGVIMHVDGYIMTNYHVIEDASGIGILLADGRYTQARVVGVDLDTDLAVLKIDLPDLPSIQLGDATTLQVGDPVLAIGDPFGVGQTATSGIVSALGRNQLGLNTYEDFIQTDAAINPGNSGGALVDMGGKLVGINTAIYSRTGGYMGIGFATSVHTAQKVLADIITYGYVQRGWIGVEVGAVRTNDSDLSLRSGVLIAGVEVNSPAAKAGLQQGDVIVSINGTAITQPQMLLSTVSGLPLREDARITVIRHGTERELTVRPIARPRAGKRGE